MFSMDAPDYGTRVIALLTYGDFSGAAYVCWSHGVAVYNQHPLAQTRRKMVGPSSVASSAEPDGQGVTVLSKRRVSYQETGGVRSASSPVQVAQAVELTWDTRSQSSDQDTAGPVRQAGGKSQ